MSLELEVLDQLFGGDLPLNVIADLFPDRDQAHRAIGALFRSGDIRILDPDGQSLPVWRYRELELVSDFWAAGASYTVSITDAGAKRMDGAL